MQSNVETLVLVFLGGGLGSTARWVLARWMDAASGPRFPWGTLLVNVSGCFIMGVLFALATPTGRFQIPNRFRDFLMAGFCGGYTTFSAFSAQTLALAQQGFLKRAGAYCILSVVLCLAAVWVGFATGRAAANAAK